jgi:hypothetical protein
MVTQPILCGKVHAYKRPHSTLSWQCSTYFAGKNRRTSTEEESLSKAKEVAEDWFLQLRRKTSQRRNQNRKTFREASEQFLREYDIITRGQRSKDYASGQHYIWCHSSAPWAFQKSQPARFRITAFTATRKPRRSPQLTSCGQNQKGSKTN